MGRGERLPPRIRAWVRPYLWWQTGPSAHRLWGAGVETGPARTMAERLRTN